MKPPIFLVGETAEKAEAASWNPEAGVNFIGHLRALLHATWDATMRPEFSGVFVVSNEKKGPKPFFWVKNEG